DCCTSVAPLRRTLNLLFNRMFIVRLPANIFLLSALEVSFNNQYGLEKPLKLKGLPSSCFQGINSSCEASRGKFAATYNGFLFDAFLNPLFVTSSRVYRKFASKLNQFVNF